MSNTKSVKVEIGGESVFLLGGVDDAVDYFRPGMPELCAVGSGKGDGFYTLYRSASGPKVGTAQVQ